jgi:radical SAM superfamily enzyme YgiQ (UPF0313 family)
LIGYPPLGLGYIASVLEQEGHSVKILDASLEGKDTKGVLAEIDVYKPKVVGTTVLTLLYAQAKEIVRQVREEFPQIITIAGGPHVTVLPEETLRDMEPHYIVVGEGEVTVLELLRAMESQRSAENIIGVGSIKDSIVKLNRRRDFIADLDALPFPARHLMKIKKYGGARSTRISLHTPILASRGCPFNCGFCCNASLWQRRYRQRSPQNVVKEMVHIYDSFGIKDIQFIDDLFTVNKIWVKEICQEIVDTGIGFTWGCLARVDTLDRETMEVMKSSGCRALEIGVESGSELILENMNKGITIPQVIKAFQWAKELNLMRHAFFMIGYIGETEDTVKQTIDLAKKLSPSSVVFNIATPLPGTDFHKEAVSKKLIINDNWGDYDCERKAVSRTEALSGKDLLKLQVKAYIAFYLRKEFLWENIILRIARDGGYDKNGIFRLRLILGRIYNLMLFALFALKSIIRYFRSTS